MDALEAIFSRRSTRRMKPDLPSEEEIHTVLEAGRAAPSGSNSRQTHFIVITDPEVLARLAELVKDAFAAMELKEDMYVSLKHSITAAKSGTYVFHYGAPMLIVTANKTGYGNAMADSACALENMMIAAQALGLGSCWINQLHWLTDEPQIKDYMRTLGLGEDEFITGGLILGYGVDGAPAGGERPDHGNPVTWIRKEEK